MKGTGVVQDHLTIQLLGMVTEFWVAMCMNQLTNVYLAVIHFFCDSSVVCFWSKTKNKLPILPIKRRESLVSWRRYKRANSYSYEG